MVGSTDLGEGRGKQSILVLQIVRGRRVGLRSIWLPLGGFRALSECGP